MAGPVPCANRSMPNLLINNWFDCSAKNQSADGLLMRQQNPAFEAMLRELLAWAAQENLTIAQRSAACREIADTVNRRAGTGLATEVLRRTRTAMLRAGIDI